MSVTVQDKLFKQIDITKVPNHVAVIMDGNGRWAKKQGKSRNLGHQEGINSVHRIIKASIKLKVKYLTKN